jgi:hypothetical protein
MPFDTTVQIPFSGFYESLHDSVLDDYVEDGLAYRLFDTHPDELTPSQEERLDEANRRFSGWHWLKLDYAEKYIQLALDALDIHIDWEFDGLASPRYYNFESDRIFAKVNYHQLRAHFRGRDKNRFTWAKFSTWLKERMAGRDGFIPHYSNSLLDWGHTKTWDHNQWGLVLEYLWWFEEPDSGYPVFVEDFYPSSDELEEYFQEAINASQPEEN